MGMSGGGILSNAATAITGLGSAVAGAAGGFVAGAISTGNANGAMQGALSGGLFGAACSVGADSSIQRYVAHAAAGCVSAVAGSGRCGSGAAAAVFGKYATNVTGGITDPIARGVVASVAGGVGSMIAGGKFENGAVTAAYGYLFNELQRYLGSGRERYALAGYGSQVANEGDQNITWKPNYPATIPVDDPAADALQCTANCIGRDLYATGGQEQSGHSKNSDHYIDEAVDFRSVNATASKVLSCAANCGYEGGWFESWKKSHWHFQLRAGNGVPQITPDPVIKRDSVR